MSKMINKIVYILLVVCLVGIIFFLLKNKMQWQPRTVTQDSTIVVEKIQKVLKLVTVEGHFSEILEHEEFYGFDIAPLRKKALIRAQAKVLVGYDLDSLEMILNDETHQVIIKRWPKPEILSIEHDIDYYDVSEGWFNSFDNKNYTELNKLAKRKIELATYDNGLIEVAEEQFSEFQEILEDLIHGMGWELIMIENTESPPRLD